MDIDVVILWVDGSDPAWLAQKREYMPPAEGDSDSANRYRDCPSSPKLTQTLPNSPKLSR